MAYVTKTHDPADRLDYEINWQPDPDTLPEGEEPFLAEGDVITSSSWTAYTDKWVETDDFVIDEDSHTDTTSVGWVAFSGLTFAGKNYFATCHGVAASGREKDKSIKILCREQ